MISRNKPFHYRTTYHFSTITEKQMKLNVWISLSSLLVHVNIRAHDNRQIALVGIDVDLIVRRFC